MTKLSTITLSDKYLKEEGTIILSGIQALVRVLFDQHRADQRAGLNTAGFVSGYRGSPLGGIDFELQRNQKLMDQHQMVFMPGVNEDLGATAVMGSQFANLLESPKYDGVIGMWYGKGPGVDRSGDIFKHANLAGVGKYGGVLALAGDDPFCKSSTIPSHSEVALYDAQMPVLFPGTVQEIIELGRLGYEMSRYTGLWVGFKIVTDVADSYSTANVSLMDNIQRPEWDYKGAPWSPNQSFSIHSPFTLGMEREVVEGRLEAAKIFAEANGLNQITHQHKNDWLGIIAAGKTYYDTREALQQLGLDDKDLGKYGIRLLRMGMIYPAEPNIIKEFAEGLEEIVLVEEKRGFMELLIRDVLYNQPNRPNMVGKKDEEGNFFIPAYDDLYVDIIAPLLSKRLAKKVPAELVAKWEELFKPKTSSVAPLAPSVQRGAYFCSGCPHNRSTHVPEGSIAYGGIGCHAMSLSMGRENFGITHMGGEGAQWLGASHFSNINHVFQNIGDGTLFHSGYLSIRQAVAANATMTYKILYNAAVAMTGGQAIDGEMMVPELTQALNAEGVKKIIVVADDVDKYPATSNFATGVNIWHRTRLDEAQRILREIEGVTVLIYDQACAADMRRKRKRGKLPTPPKQVFINEAICEGCGDCGKKSNCLSVFPTETEYGRKTQIHQSSCNRDYTCLEGDCPAFVTVIPKEVNHSPNKKLVNLPPIEKNIEAPIMKVPDDARIYMMGIGGTGVVTVSQILATAFLLDGKETNNLDQTGMSQKGGSVHSHIKVIGKQKEISNRVNKGQADSYLVFDILTGTAQKNLSIADSSKTVAVVSSSEIPTGGMVTDTTKSFPRASYLKSRIEAHSRAEDNVYVDAITLSEKFFGSHMPANIMLLGAAYQGGTLPLRAEAIEKAIELNGVKVDQNIQAFRAGRMIVLDPSWLDQFKAEAKPVKEEPKALSPQVQALVEQVGAEGELLRLLQIRVPELIAYQNQAYAQTYVDFVKKVKAREDEIGATDSSLSEAVARYLFKLMAYKDEYEVARLSLKSQFSEAIKQQFGKGAKVKYQLHPPILRALGLKKKLGFGKWFNAAYWLLTKMKGLRGTAFDIFGYAEVRKVERELIPEYRSLIEAELEGLSTSNYDQAVKLAELPDMIRGYEHVKLGNVDLFRAEVEKMKVGMLVEQ